MGEIGIPRREFLYDIRYWEAHLIFNGYRRRHRLLHQLIAENVYATIHTMRDPKGKTVGDMFPQVFDDDDEYEFEPPISDEEARDMQGLIDAENERLRMEQQQQ